MITYYTTDMDRWGRGVDRSLHWSEIENIFGNFSDRIVALGGVKPVIIYRMTGPRGPGKDAPLLWEEIDLNWHNCNEQISALDGLPPEDLNEFNQYEPRGSDENNFKLDSRLRKIEQAKRNVQ